MTLKIYNTKPNGIQESTMKTFISLNCKLSEKPFIYNLVTKCLCKPTEYSSPKSLPSLILL